MRGVEPLTCGSGSVLTVVEPAGFAEELVSCEIGPFLTESSQVELKDSHHTLEVPWQVPEESCGCQEACQGAGKKERYMTSEKVWGHQLFFLEKRPKLVSFRSSRNVFSLFSTAHTSVRVRL